MLFERIHKINSIILKEGSNMGYNSKKNVSLTKKGEKFYSIILQYKSVKRFLDKCNQFYI